MDVPVAHAHTWLMAQGAHARAVYTRRAPVVVPSALSPDACAFAYLCARRGQAERDGLRARQGSRCALVGPVRNRRSGQHPRAHPVWVVDALAGWEGCQGPRACSPRARGRWSRPPQDRGVQALPSTGRMPHVHGCFVPFPLQMPASTWKAVTRFFKLRTSPARSHLSRMRGPVRGRRLRRRI